jgi:hypothetical protein
VATDGSSAEYIVISQKPRPRRLVRGFENQDELVQGILATAPTARQIRQLTEVRQAEWDILVTDVPLFASGGAQARTQSAVSRHLCVIYVAEKDFAGIIEDVLVDQKPHREMVYVEPDHVSGELHRQRALPARIVPLARALEPVAADRVDHPHFYVSRLHGDAPTELIIEPFLVTGGGKVLAGRYLRSASSETWLLPSDVTHLASWVETALAEWHQLNPDRFPGLPDWSTTARWMTSAEKAISNELSELNRSREHLLRQLEGERAAADNYERSLLTTQSEPLVNAVIRALTELGFTVKNADAEAGRRDHLEDLHVEDTDAPGWLAIAEVKGYTKGAKTEALIQLMRFQMRFLQRTGSAPLASWYIGNQFLGQDPASRQPFLHGKDDDIAAFGAAGGLIIDTVALFGLLMSVRNGDRTAEQAREMLRTSTGLLSLDPWIEPVCDGVEGGVEMTRVPSGLR